MNLRKDHLHVIQKCELCMSVLSVCGHAMTTTLGNRRAAWCIDGASWRVPAAVRGVDVYLLWYLLFPNMFSYGCLGSNTDEGCSELR